jgi:DNA polymerase III sliding clamp (beta) subunit (PCNA family)
MKKQTLLNALELVKPGLAGKEAIEQSTSFVFIKGNIVTYNDSISVSHPLPELLVEGAVPANELYNLLNRIKSEDIEVTVLGNELHINAGKAKAGVSLVDEIKLPLSEIGAIDEWQPLPERFLKGIEMAMYSCSRNLSEPITNCVYVNEKGFVEGTNNYKITHFELQNPMPVPSFLLPSYVVPNLVKLKPIEVSKGDGWVHFRTEQGTVISCRIVDDKYPDTTMVLEKSGIEIIFPKTIQEMLERACVFSKRENTDLETVEIQIENKTIKVRSQNESGWFEEEGNIRYEGGTLCFIISPVLLKEIVKETLAFLYADNLLRFDGEGWTYIAALETRK